MLPSVCIPPLSGRGVVCMRGVKVRVREGVTSIKILNVVGGWVGEINNPFNQGRKCREAIELWFIERVGSIEHGVEGTELFCLVLGLGWGEGGGGRISQASV